MLSYKSVGVLKYWNIKVLTADLWSHLPVKSVDATLDFVVDKFWVENILSELSVMVTVGDEHVVVELLLSATAGNDPVDQEEEEEEDDGDGGDQVLVIIATADQLGSLRWNTNASKDTESPFLVLRQVDWLIERQSGTATGERIGREGDVDLRLSQILNHPRAQALQLVGWKDEFLQTWW